MKGIDIPIEALRQTFEDNLWTDKEYTSYGRAFINYRNKGVDKIPEVMIPDTKEYKDVQLNDKIDGLSFFVADSNRTLTTDGIIEDLEVGLYFAVNLKKIYPSVPERATEYAHEDVLKLIDTSEFNAIEIITGYDAFSEFGMTKKTDNMQPFYLFKIKLSLKYNKNC